MIRTVVLLQCLKEAGYFEGKSHSKKQEKLTGDELYIGELLFHFQSGIQYNLHTVYQVIERVKRQDALPQTTLT